MNAPIRIVELAALVDRLAELKAMIEPMQKEEAAIKDQLKASGLERIDGTKHTAVNVLSERETIDTKQLRADLGEDIIAPYLSRSLVHALRLTARRTAT